MSTTNPQGGSGLAPDVNDAQAKLTASLNATQAVSAYCHALLNTAIFPPAVSQMNWADFQSNLGVAQTHAQYWVDTLGPVVSAKVPQGIINYGSTFTNATNDIVNIISSAPNNIPTPDQSKEILQLVQALLDALRAEKVVVEAIHGTSPLLTLGQPYDGPVTTLEQFSAAVQGDYTRLKTGKDDVQTASGLNQQQIDSINTQITKLQQEISTANKIATASEVGLGLGLFLAVASIGLAIVTGGVGAMVVGAVAVVGVGGAIASTAVFSVEADKEVAELHQEQQALSDDQKIATALSGITNSVDGLITQNEMATEAMTAVLTMWLVLEGKLEAVIVELQAADADPAGILQALDIQTAQTRWSQLTEFATQMQEVASGVTVQPPIVHPSAATTV
jgi:hypothetical protein